MSFETVIGLEVHLQLSTKTKIFCGCAVRFGEAVNSQTCPVCLGLPGVLPVLNRETLNSGVKVALSLNCKVRETLKFDRKNYFYPDLPKNFQISQYDMPLGFNGQLEVFPPKDESFTVRILRVHMEEDAGKLIHQQGGKVGLVDYNRTGVPLLEIVSEPDMRSPEQAYQYLQTLKQTLKYLGVSTCDMEKGSLRCDANISLRKTGAKELGVKAEVKNLNSFKAVRAALAFEVDRQGQLLSEGKKITQETLLWDDAKQKTQSMRSKEFAHDYRYFPEPDLMVFSVSKETVSEVQGALPELPRARSLRLVKEYQLSDYDARGMCAERETADFFEAGVKAGGVPKLVANWIQGDLAALANERHVGIYELGLTSVHLASLTQLLEKKTINSKMAKELLPKILETKKDPSELIKELGLEQVSDQSALKAVAQKVIEANPKAVEDYRKGKVQSIKFMVGQMMRETKGQAAPDVAAKALEEVLNS